MDEDDLLISEEVADALMRQDRALALLDRLRAEQPFRAGRNGTAGGGRRDFRRWPTPPGATLELHDEIRWQPVACADLGVGGARVQDLPTWVEGPLPVRLSAPGVPPVIVLADVMWRARAEKYAGLRFEFQDEEERDAWAGALIDALLAHHSLA